MDARASLILLLCVCVVLGVARSDLRLPGAGEEAGVEISFWNGFTGPDGRTMLRMIRDFNEAHPDVRVTMQRMAWATYYNKLMVACIDGRGPDLFIIHASTLPRMERAGFISPAEDFYDEVEGPPLSDFDPHLLEQLEFGGHLLGLPLDIHPQGLYGNVDLLREAGFVDEEGNARLPADREEFLELARLGNRDLDGDGRNDVWGYNYTFWRMNLQSLIPQFGGRYMDEEGRCDLAHPGNVEALDFLTMLHRDLQVVPEPENTLGWIGFRQKKVAMVFDGVYMLGDLQRLDDLEVIGAPIPVIGSQPGTLGDAHVACIRKGVSPEQREAAIRFIRYLSNESLTWAGAGQVPARRSVRETEGFRALPIQYAFSKQVPHVMFPPKTPVLFEIQLELDLAVEKAFRGRASPREALEVATRNVQAYLDRDARLVADMEGAP